MLFFCATQIQSAVFVWGNNKPSHFDTLEIFPWRSSTFNIVCQIFGFGKSVWGLVQLAEVENKKRKNASWKTNKFSTRNFKFANSIFFSLKKLRNPSRREKNFNRNLAKLHQNENVYAEMIMSTLQWRLPCLL